MNNITERKNMIDYKAIYGLKVGEVYNKDIIRKLFHGGVEGGIMTPKGGNVIGLLSDQGKTKCYRDMWSGGILKYHGSGQKGDQTLTGKNKTLYESNKNGKIIHLFESTNGVKYTYKGIVKFTGELDEDETPGSDKVIRKALVFSLVLVK